MNIDKLILRECPGDINNLHNSAYTRALRLAYNKFCNMSIEKLKICLNMVREGYRIQGSTHQATADCVVLFELINKKQSIKKWGNNAKPYSWNQFGPGNFFNQDID